MKELLAKYVAYNLWANGIFTDLILKLPDGDVYKEMPSSFKTIQETVFHICFAENIWMQRLLLAERIIPLNEDLKNDTLPLCKELINQSTQLQKWVSGKNELALTHVFEYKNLKGEFFKQPVNEVLLHVCNHGSYHRGQLVNMLRQMGHEKIPQTDFSFWSRSKRDWFLSSA